MAADQGHAVAQSKKSGFILQKEESIEQNKEAALRYFEIIPQ